MALSFSRRLSEQVLDRVRQWNFNDDKARLSRIGGDCRDDGSLPDEEPKTFNHPWEIAMISPLSRRTLPTGSATV